MYSKQIDGVTIPDFLMENIRGSKHTGTVIPLFTYLALRAKEGKAIIPWTLKERKEIDSALNWGEFTTKGLQMSLWILMSLGYIKMITDSEGIPMLRVDI